MKGTLRESESIAASVLSSMGFNVIDYHVKVVIEGAEISDIDLVAEKGGERYAVEVKAGYVDVSSVRQAYVNAVITGMKPLIVARGFSDEGARALSRALGVQVIVLPDQLVVQPDELGELVRDSVERALEDILLPLAACGSLTGEDLKVLDAIASSRSFDEAARALGVSSEELGRAVSSLRERGLLPRGGFRSLRLASILLRLCRGADV